MFVGVGGATGEKGTGAQQKQDGFHVRKVPRESSPSIAARAEGCRWIDWFAVGLAAAKFIHHCSGRGRAATGRAEFADPDQAIEIADAAGGFDLHFWGAAFAHEAEIVLGGATTSEDLAATIIATVLGQIP